MTAKIITMPCPHWHTALQIPAQHLGQSGHCKHCQGEIVVYDPEAPAPETQQCPHCKETVHQDAKICKHCGKQIISQQQTRTCLIASGLLAFALVLGFGSCFSSMQKSIDSSRERLAEEQSHRENFFQELRPIIEQAFRDDTVYSDYLKPVTQPEAISLTSTGWIVAEFELSNFMVGMIFQSDSSRERAVEDVSSRLCLQMRNTAYKNLPEELRDEFNYRVSIYAPPPGPGLVAPLGSARFTNRMRFEWLQP